MLYKFKLGYNMEATKNISCVKGEGAFDHNTLTRWFNKFYLDCKYLNNLSLASWPKTAFWDHAPSTEADWVSSS